MADENTRNDRDLVLAPNEYAFISDSTKGEINVFVGPHKTSLANTDRCVVFNDKSKRFEPTEKLGTGISLFKTAPEGYYVVLKNPAENDKLPPSNGKLTTPMLRVGKKVNVPGPVSFALWPGQMAKVVRGHRIRSNQYLVVQVYDELAARQNWNASVVIPNGSDESRPEKLGVAASDLTMGRLLIIKGTDVSFYIPPTGIEVVADENGKLEREAVTLERLEYCLLLDENGNKRYQQGPAVIFPEPTEVFRTRSRRDESGNETGETTRKFRAIELNPTSGIYVKVIADYTDDDGTLHKTGDELFITGKETALYFPREEHAIIKYSDQEVHFATAIPEGEARYVLNRNTGNIRLEKGPVMFLPDPRNEVLTRRVLDSKTCDLLYPGNAEAQAYNHALLPAAANYSRTSEVIGDMYLASNAASFGTPAPAMAFSVSLSDSAESRGLRGRVGKGFTGDNFNRPQSYTEPRTVTLNTKYQGAVTTRIFNGFAIMLVGKAGQRRVIRGPQTVMLEYDEVPEVLELSTGKPKTTDKIYRTSFLQLSNKVGDLLTVETKDYVSVQVKVSYRVNFEGDEPEKWFQVQNYVKFLCDHLRSKVRSAVRKLNIQQFYADSEDTLRNIILGEKATNGKREGHTFEENNMRIYDVEILEVTLKDKEVEKLLVDSQKGTISHNLTLVNARRELEFTKEKEQINQEKAKALAETREVEFTLRQDELELKTALDLATIASGSKTQTERQLSEKSAEEAKNLVYQIALERSKAQFEHQNRVDSAAQDLQLKTLAAEVQAVVDKAKAVSPDLIAALDTFGERAMVEKAVEAMAPLSILGGGKRSVLEIVAELLKGSNLAKQLPPAPSSSVNGSNGTGTKSPTATSTS